MKMQPTRAAMTTLVGLLVLASSCARPVPAWKLPTPPVNERAIVAEGALVRKTLPNGLHVLMLEDHTRPVVSFGLAVRRGIAIEASGSEGIATLCGEVMQRGAGGRDALEMAHSVDALGATFGVAVSWDAIHIGASGLARDADTLLQIVSDVTLRPRFDEIEVRKARDEQLAELAGAIDNPRTLLRWQIARTLYPEHRYGAPGAGRPETVAGFTAADVRSFYGRVFHPNNAIFYATGDFDAERLLGQVESALGTWMRHGVPEPVIGPPRVVPAARRIVVVDRPDMVQVQVAVAHEGLRRIDPRRIPASLLNDVLGGSGFSSRLTVSVRSDAGLTYSIRSGFSLRRRPGPFSVSTFTKAEQVRPILDLLLAEVQAIRGNRPVSDDELRNAKAFSVGQFALGLETSTAVMRSLVNLDIYELPEDSLDTYRRRVQQATTREVAALAEELLHPDRAAIVVVGPAEKLVSELESLGPVEVVTW
jgi:zinc protease